MYRAGEAQRSTQILAILHTAEHNIASERRSGLKRKKASYPYDETLPPPLILILRLSSRRKP
jgi:hypothetical protein